MTLIERLNQLREVWGWSQALVAAMLHVSRSSVSRWERGEVNPNATSTDKIEALIKALEQAQRKDAPPDVRIIGGDQVQGDQSISGDLIQGDKITTADGTTYVIRDSVVLVIPDAATLESLIRSA